jgi:hypothetical protein
VRNNGGWQESLANKINSTHSSGGRNNWSAGAWMRRKDAEVPIA